MKLNNLSTSDLYGDLKLTTKQAISQTKNDFDEPMPFYGKEETVKGPKFLTVIRNLCPVVAIGLFWLREIFTLPVIVSVLGWLLLAATIIISLLQKHLWK